MDSQQRVKMRRIAAALIALVLIALWIHLSTSAAVRLFTCKRAGENTECQCLFLMLLMALAVSARTIWGLANVALFRPQGMEYVSLLAVVLASVYLDISPISLSEPVVETARFSPLYVMLLLHIILRRICVLDREGFHRAEQQNGLDTAEESAE